MQVARSVKLYPELQKKPRGALRKVVRYRLGWQTNAVPLCGGDLTHIFAL
jgi:ribosomal protein S12